MFYDSPLHLRPVVRRTAARGRQAGPSMPRSSGQLK